MFQSPSFFLNRRFVKGIMQKSAKHPWSFVYSIVYSSAFADAIQVSIYFNKHVLVSLSSAMQSTLLWPSSYGRYQQVCIPPPITAINYLPVHSRIIWVTSPRITHTVISLHLSLTWQSPDPSLIIFRFIFRVSPAGLVTRVFHDSDDLEPLLVTKQYLTSALSAHLQVHNNIKCSLQHMHIQLRATCLLKITNSSVE